MDGISAQDEVIGRDEELAGVDGFLAAAGGGFAALLIGGQPGIGKSTVWAEAVRRADERGFRVMASRPGEGEARMSLTAIGDLLEAVPDEVLDDLPVPQRHAIEVALLRAEPGGPAIPDRVLATALRSVLARLAADTPVLVAIDDVQWLDASSADVLAFAVRRLRTERVGLLVAHRSGTPDPLHVDRLDAPVTTLDLGPLTVAALHHVIRRRLGSSLSWSVLGRVHEAAGGNALFALEIARQLVTTGIPAPGERLPVPHDVRAIVGSRVRDLPRPTRDALLVLAATGATDDGRLAAILGRPVEDDVRLAADQGVVARSGASVGFAHPLFADAVYTDAAPAERRSAHLAVAERARDLEERARHLALATPGADAELATLLEQAGTEAASRGATASAAELLELAWRATPDDDRDGRLARELRHASLLHGAGDTTRAYDRLEAIAAEAPPGPLRARALLEQAKVAFVIATLEETLALCEAARLEAGDDPRLRPEVLAILARLHPDLDRSLAYAVEALAALDAMPDPDPHALTHALTALAGTDETLWTDGRLRQDIVDRALELERIAPLPRVDDRFSASLGVWLKYGDDFEGARLWLDRTHRAALDEGDEGTLPYVYSHLPQLELWTGDWAKAEALARRHLELAEATGQESQRRQALYNLGAIHAHQGREDEARAELGAGLAAAAADGDRWTEAICLSAVGVLELSLSHHPAAAEVLEGASAIWREYGDASPRRHESDLVEALLAVGRLDDAASLAADLRARTEGGRRPSLQAGAARAAALVAAAAGDAGAADAAFTAAMAHHAAVDIPFDRARTWLALGVVRRRRRERGLARDALREGLGVFDGLGARLWAERTRGELDRLGLRKGSGDELTEAERRVAELAATGRTNREIAAALYMSPKTVDANLGRVYRKLGIGSRAELGAWVAGRQT